MPPNSFEAITTENRTARLEAFSDGVIAIAITLLVFGIAAPRDLPEGESLADALLALSPSYFAYVISFLTIGVMWINHHNLFKVINQSDHLLMVLNILLMLMITFVNFPTAVLGTYITDPQEQRTAVVFLNGTYALIAIVFNVLWRYASGQRRLLDASADDAVVRGISRAYNFGLVAYSLSLVVAFVVPLLGLLMNFSLAVFFALPPRTNLFGGD
jgi:uncharacterized membrane protein